MTPSGSRKRHHLDRMGGSLSSMTDRAAQGADGEESEGDGRCPADQDEEPPLRRLGNGGSPERGAETMPEASSSLQKQEASPDPDPAEVSQHPSPARGGSQARKRSAPTGSPSYPCQHCGRVLSPAWRRGPEGKERLCNACGVRFLHKGSLEGYFPKFNDEDDHVSSASGTSQGGRKVARRTFDQKAPSKASRLSGRRAAKAAGHSEEADSDADDAQHARAARAGVTSSQASHLTGQASMVQHAALHQGRASSAVSAPTALGLDSLADLLAEQQAADGGGSGQAGEATSWVELVEAAAKLGPDNWRDVASLVHRALIAASQDPACQGTSIMAELQRAQGLLWANREAGVKLLRELLDAEVLMLLGGLSGETAVADTGRSHEPARASAEQDAKASPQPWFELLDRIKKVKAGQADAICMLLDSAIRSASSDPNCPAQVVPALHAAAVTLETVSVLAAKRAIASVREAYTPQWAYCSECGKARLATRRLPPWADFKCGDAAALLPSRTCEDAQDDEQDWFVPDQQPGPRPAAVSGVVRPSMVKVANSHDVAQTGPSSSGQATFSRELPGRPAPHAPHATKTARAASPQPAEPRKKARGEGAAKRSGRKAGTHHSQDDRYQQANAAGLAGGKQLRRQRKPSAKAADTLGPEGKSWADVHADDDDTHSEDLMPSDEEMPGRAGPVAGARFHAQHPQQQQHVARGHRPHAGRWTEAAGHAQEAHVMANDDDDEPPLPRWGDARPGRHKWAGQERPLHPKQHQPQAAMGRDDFARFGPNGLHRAAAHPLHHPSHGPDFLDRVVPGEALHRQQRVASQEAAELPTPGIDPSVAAKVKAVAERLRQEGQVGGSPLDPDVAAKVRAVQEKLAHERSGEEVAPAPTAAAAHPRAAQQQAYQEPFAAGHQPLDPGLTAKVRAVQERFTQPQRPGQFAALPPYMEAKIQSVQERLEHEREAREAGRAAPAANAHQARSQQSMFAERDLAGRERRPVWPGRKGLPLLLPRPERAVVRPFFTNSGGRDPLDLDTDRDTRPAAQHAAPPQRSMAQQQVPGRSSLPADDHPVGNTGPGWTVPKPVQSSSLRVYGQSLAHPMRSQDEQTLLHRPSSKGPASQAGNAAANGSAGQHRQQASAQPGRASPSAFSAGELTQSEAPPRDSRASQPRPEALCAAAVAERIAKDAFGIAATHGVEAAHEAAIRSLAAAADRAARQAISSQGSMSQGGMSAGPPGADAAKLQASTAGGSTGNEPPALYSSQPASPAVTDTGRKAALAQSSMAGFTDAATRGVPQLSQARSSILITHADIAPGNGSGKAMPKPFICASSARPVNVQPGRNFSLLERMTELVNEHHVRSGLASAPVARQRAVPQPSMQPNAGSGQRTAPPPSIQPNAGLGQRTAPLTLNTGSGQQGVQPPSMQANTGSGQRAALQQPNPGIAQRAVQQLPMQPSAGPAQRMAAPLGTTGSLQRAVPPSSFQSNTGSVAHSTGPRESQRDSKPPSYFIPAKSAGQPAIRVRAPSNVPELMPRLSGSALDLVAPAADAQRGKNAQQHFTADRGREFPDRPDTHAPAQPADPAQHAFAGQRPAQQGQQRPAQQPVPISRIVEQVRGKYGGIDARRPPEIAHILDSVQRRFGGQPGDPPEAGGQTRLDPHAGPAAQDAVQRSAPSAPLDLNALLQRSMQCLQTTSAPPPQAITTSRVVSVPARSRAPAGGQPALSQTSGMVRPAQYAQCPAGPAGLPGAAQRASYGTAADALASLHASGRSAGEWRPAGLAFSTAATNLSPQVSPGRGSAAQSPPQLPRAASFGNLRAGAAANLQHAGLSAEAKPEAVAASQQQRASGYQLGQSAARRSPQAARPAVQTGPAGTAQQPAPAPVPDAALLANPQLVASTVVQRQLGRSISDPHTIQQALAAQRVLGTAPTADSSQPAEGNPALQPGNPGADSQDAPAGASAAAQATQAPEPPSRQLARAITDPTTLQSVRAAVDAAFGANDMLLPSRASCISWQGVVRAPAANEQGYADLFNLVAALPPATAASLPTELVISGFRPRADIPMSTATDKPLMLHLGPMTEAQHNALTALEALKMAALVLLPDYDLALIPHSNARNLLHVVGLKMQKNAPGKLQPLPATLLAGCLPAR